MTLQAPKLDDRHFQDIVDEAKKRIPHYAKEWTDHNVSDPGVTLIELFAWMTDIILYRLNQVPDKHYIKMMEMLGITLQPPMPAHVPVTFWLSAPQETVVTIPAGTEVASTQTETEPSIVFTTEKPLSVQLPELTAVLARKSDGKKGKVYDTQNLRRLQSGFSGFEVFTRVPEVDDALYFGFKNDLSHHILGFEFDFDPAGGAGIDPSLPPYLWEAATGREGDDRWQLCRIDIDSTKGMNAGGRIRIHLPQMGAYSVNKQNQYWVRARVRDVTTLDREDGMSPYTSSPRLRQVNVATWGGSVPATHSQTLRDEFLGQSDGSAGQRFQLQVRPVLTRQPGQTLEVQIEGMPRQAWREVANYANSGAQDTHFTLDSTTGEVRLGPAVRQPDGTIKLYGRIPPRGSNLIFSSYTSGGGQKGNVQPGIINTLKTGIPFISRVSNLEPAWGGKDAESLEAAMMRVPGLLTSRDRAVTEKDFEFLARQALPAAIGRVKCLQPRPSEAGRVTPGQVYVLVVPRLPHPAGYLEPAVLEPNESDLSALTAYLDERRLLTTRLDIRAPSYRWVSAVVQLRAAPGINEADVEAEVLRRLYRYLNPLTGGPDGEGWPFGRDLFLSDVYQSLQGMANVQFVRNIAMYQATPGGGPQGDPLESIEVVGHGVITSGLHVVEFV